MPATIHAYKSPQGYHGSTEMASSHSDSRVGFSCFTGLAIVGQTGSAPKSKTVFLDAEIFLGGKSHGSLLGSVRYFNNNDINFCDFPGGLLCMVRTLVNLSLCVKLWLAS